MYGSGPCPILLYFGLGAGEGGEIGWAGRVIAKEQEIKLFVRRVMRRTIRLRRLGGGAAEIIKQRFSRCRQFAPSSIEFQNDFRPLF